MWPKSKITKVHLCAGALIIVISQLMLSVTKTLTQSFHFTYRIQTFCQLTDFSPLFWNNFSLLYFISPFLSHLDVLGRWECLHPLVWRRTSSDRCWRRPTSCRRRREDRTGCLPTPETSCQTFYLKFWFRTLSRL